MSFIDELVKRITSAEDEDDASDAANILGLLIERRHANYQNEYEGGASTVLGDLAGVELSDDDEQRACRLLTDHLLSGSRPRADAAWVIGRRFSERDIPTFVSVLGRLGGDLEHTDVVESALDALALFTERPEVIRAIERLAAEGVATAREAAVSLLSDLRLRGVSHQTQQMREPHGGF